MRVTKNCFLCGVPLAGEGKKNLCSDDAWWWGEFEGLHSSFFSDRPLREIVKTAWLVWDELKTQHPRMPNSDIWKIFARKVGKCLPMMPAADVPEPPSEIIRMLRGLPPTTPQDGGTASPLADGVQPASDLPVAAVPVDGNGTRPARKPPSVYFTRQERMEIKRIKITRQEATWLTTQVVSRRPDLDRLVKARIALDRREWIAARVAEGVASHEASRLFTAEHLDGCIARRAEERERERKPLRLPS